MMVNHIIDYHYPNTLFPLNKTPKKMLPPAAITVIPSIVADSEKCILSYTDK
jgi:hypothetical protein